LQRPDHISWIWERQGKEWEGIKGRGKIEGKEKMEEKGRVPLSSLALQPLNCLSSTD